MHVHTGVGHTTPAAIQLNIFDSEKLTFFLVLLTGCELGPLDRESAALPIEPPRHPWEDTGARTLIYLR